MNSTVHILGGPALAPLGPACALSDADTSGGQWWNAAASDRSYPSAGRNTVEDHARTYGAGFSRGGSADSHLSASRLRTMRTDSQFYYRANVVARTIVETLVACVLGPEGLRLSVAASDNPDENRAIENAFAAWLDELDYRGLFSGPELQHAAFRSAFVDGDVLGYFVRDDNGAGPLRLQLIESERIGGADLPALSGSPHGITLDQAGRIIAFRVADYDRSSGRVQRVSRSLSPSDCLFLANLQRPSQTRGEPGLCRLLPYLDQINRAIGSTITAYQMATLFGLVTYTSSPAGTQKSLPGRTAAGPDGASQRTAESPGGPQMWHAERGDNVVQVKPEHPTQNLPEFLRFMLRMMGMEIGLPLELLLRDYSDGNFFSARAARQDAEVAFRVWRERFARKFMTPIFRAWLDLDDVERGVVIPRRLAAPLRTLGRDGHLWQGPVMPVFDEVAEATANRILMETNQESVLDIAEKRGKDGEELLARIRRARAVEVQIPPATWMGKSGQTDPSKAIANAAAADANGSAAKA